MSTNALIRVVERYIELVSGLKPRVFDGARKLAILESGTSPLNPRNAEKLLAQGALSFIDEQYLIEKIAAVLCIYIKELAQRIDLDGWDYVNQEEAPPAGVLNTVLRGNDSTQSTTRMSYCLAPGPTKAAIDALQGLCNTSMNALISQDTMTNVADMCFGDLRYHVCLNGHSSPSPDNREDIKRLIGLIPEVLWRFDPEQNPRDSLGSAMGYQQVHLQLLRILLVIIKLQRADFGLRTVLGDNRRIKPLVHISDTTVALVPWLKIDQLMYFAEPAGSVISRKAEAYLFAIADYNK